MAPRLGACKDNPANDRTGDGVHDRLNELLRALECEMRDQGRWEQRAPSAKALASTQPFAVDTLSFDQWLQWVFIRQLRRMLSMRLPLPSDCAVCPMAEAVYGADDADGERLRAILAKVDALLSTDGEDLN